MRILLALGTSTGGVGRHVHDLAAALASRGEHVVVAAPEEVLEQFAFAGVAERVEVLSVTDRPHPRKDVATVAALRVAAAGVDVVHVHGLRVGALAVLALARTGVPLVVTLHNAAPEGRVGAAIHRALEMVVAKGADLVLGVSSDLVRGQSRLGARRAQLAVVPAATEPVITADRYAVRAASTACSAVGSSPARCTAFDRRSSRTDPWRRTSTSAEASDSASPTGVRRAASPTTSAVPPASVATMAAPTWSASCSATGWPSQRADDTTTSAAAIRSGTSRRWPRKLTGSASRRARPLRAAAKGPSPATASTTGNRCRSVTIPMASRSRSRSFCGASLAIVTSSGTPSGTARAALAAYRSVGAGRA